MRRESHGPRPTDEKENADRERAGPPGYASADEHVSIVHVTGKRMIESPQLPPTCTRKMRELLAMPHVRHSHSFERERAQSSTCSRYAEVSAVFLYSQVLATI